MHKRIDKTYVHSSKISNYSTELYHYINGLVQDCSKFIANALELLQSCSKTSIIIMNPGRICMM